MACPLDLPVVWSDDHRRHATNGGYWLGVREAGDEEPERGDLLRDGLAALGAAIVDPPDLGPAPIEAVHDPAFVAFMSRAHRDWVAAGHPDDPGQPYVVPYLFALPGFAARHRSGRRPATIRAEVGLYAMDTMTLIGAGTYDAAASAAVPSARIPAQSWRWVGLPA
jgi:acetoin utilization deacetylase AcuC-like enzyme